MRDMNELIVVAANWKWLALWLGVVGCVSKVMLTSNPNNCEGACRYVLTCWLKDPHTGEEQWTWSILLIALDRTGFKEWRLRKEHFHKAISQ